jgi:hypothetical protein
LQLSELQCFAGRWCWEGVSLGPLSFA